MSLDGIVINALSAELKKVLANARLERIIQLDKSSIILSWYTGEKRLQNLISVNKNQPLFIVEPKIKASSLPTPPNFLNVLRKYLTGARLCNIYSPSAERIIEMEFLTLNDFHDQVKKYLVIELMPRVDNIILLNASRNIHDAIFHVSSDINRYREILPAHPYLPPPPQSKIALSDFQGISAIKDDNLSIANKSFVAFDADIPQSTTRSAVKEENETAPPELQIKMAHYTCRDFLLHNFAGIGKNLVASILRACDLNPEENFANLPDAYKSRLEKELFKLQTLILEQKFTPCCYYGSADLKGSPLDMHVLPLYQYAFKKDFASCLDAASLYFDEIRTKSRQKDAKSELLTVLKSLRQKAEKKLDIHLHDAAQGEKYDRDKTFGELLLANIYRLDDFSESCELFNFYDNNKIVTIPLNKRFSIADNARAYFKSYRKNQRKYAKAHELIKEDRDYLDYLESLRVMIENAKTDDLPLLAFELHNQKPGKKTSEKPENERDYLPGKPAGKKSRNKKRFSPRTNAKADNNVKESVRKYQTSEGYTLLIGRNNIQNDKLTLKTARKTDMFFHVKDSPGAHVILVTEGEKATEKAITEACGIAAFYSGKSHGMGAKIAVDYCEVKNVWKAKGARPGQVLYDNYKTLMVTPLDPESL